MKATALSRSKASTKNPRKLFYRIQEVSRMTGLKPYVLRYWETEFRELHPPKDTSDQRRYRQGDIEVVLAIRKLLYEDRFTIEVERKRLREELRKVRGQEKVSALPTAATRKKSAAPHNGKNMNHSLISLRREVNQLLEILSD